MFFQLLIFGDYLTFGSGLLCVWISGFLGSGDFGDFWILIVVNPFQDMQVMFFQLFILALETILLLDLDIYVLGIQGIWNFQDLGFLDFNSSQSFQEHVGNVLLALYIGFGGYLTFGSGQLCFPLQLPHILQVSKPFSILPISVLLPGKKGENINLTLHFGGFDCTKV